MWLVIFFFFFFSSRRRHTRCSRDWSSDVCSSDLEAAELEHPEEVGFVELPASYEPTEVMQPNEKAFDFPATTVTAQLATVLGQIQAVGAVGRDHANAVLAPQLAVQGVAVVGRIADHSFRPSTGETVLEGAFDEFRFMRRSAGHVAGHTSELQSRLHLVCRLLLEKKKNTHTTHNYVML